MAVTVATTLRRVQAPARARRLPSHDGIANKGMKLPGYMASTQSSEARVAATLRRVQPPVRSQATAGARRLPSHDGNTNNGMAPSSLLPCKLPSYMASTQSSEAKVRNRGRANRAAKEAVVDRPPPHPSKGSKHTRRTTSFSHPTNGCVPEASPDDQTRPSRSFDAPTINSAGSEINHEKLRRIEDVVQKLNELSEAQSTDHRYVAEIILASGLLLRDLSAVQLHPCGHPINPDLFLVLEQTKTTKAGHEKLHRKLLFDMVNEVLIRKLELTRKTGVGHPSGQQLLREVCMEVDRCQALSEVELEDMVSGEEVVRRSAGWAEFDTEVPGLVLEIERSILNELIGEVVNLEALSTCQSKASRRRRQPFATKL